MVKNTNREFNIVIFVRFLFDVCSTGELAQVVEPNNQASSMFFNDVEPNNVKPHKLR